MAFYIHNRDEAYEVFKEIDGKTIYNSFDAPYTVKALHFSDKNDWFFVLDPNIRARLTHGEYKLDDKVTVTVNRSFAKEHGLV